MDYEGLVKMWQEDSAIDGERLDHESLQIPCTQGKYFNLLCRERAILTKLTLDLKKLKRWKRDYLLGEIPHEELVAKGIPVMARRIVKSDVDIYVDSDDEVIAKLELIAVVQTKLDFLELCVESLNRRGLNIRAAIDFMKFKNGVL